MAKITNIKGRQVFDSRGNPTVEAEIFLENGISASAIVPSGASTGKHEAFELKDKDNQDYLGKSVFQSVEIINDIISKKLKGYYIYDLEKIDKTLIELDGTKQKNKLGANSILAVSIAAVKAHSKVDGLPLYNFGGKCKTLPRPLMNIINGGAHANNSLRIQEFMIRPDIRDTFKEGIRICFIVINNLKLILEKKKYSTNVGDEGGFAPSLSSNEEAIELIIEAIEKAGFEPGKDVSLCLDIAANELFKNGKYSIKSTNFETAEDTIQYYVDLINKYPIRSIEDPFAEDDWKSWISFTKVTKSESPWNAKVQIVGDDLFVTNPERLIKGIKNKAGNAILIKPNQIGTFSETCKVIDLAHENGYRTIISHRSGDSEDTFISDLAVGAKSSQIKTGSLSRSERVAKYNRLLRIEEELGKQAKMANI
jgi:enolase